MSFLRVSISSSDHVDSNWDIKHLELYALNNCWYTEYIFLDSSLLFSSIQMVIENEVILYTMSMFSKPYPAKG